MSFIQLNANTQQYHVVIPCSKRVPPNPHIGDGPAALDRALVPPSETGHTNSELIPESRDDKELRYRLLACDQRSFFTGSAAADLQAAHIITAIRRNPERKQRVEAYLTQQKLHPPTRYSFVLDNVHNAILLEANLHVQWDLYGTFCFVPSEEDANAMLHELRTSNQIWERNHVTQAAFGGRAVRPLDISNPPFARPRWEVVLLHPRALLPDGQPIAIAENRPLCRRGQTESPTTPTWRLWVASGDHLRDEFQLPPLCSLAMVINAHCKLEQFLQNHGASASNRVKKFGLLMSELVTEIFFVPSDGYDNVALAPSEPETVRVPTMTGANIAHSVPPASRFLSFSVPGFSHTFPSDPTVEATDPTVINGFRGEVEAPEIPDEDGLTNSEFRLLASKVEEPNLNAKERADAAIMMLFGTHRYADPYNHTSQFAQS